MSSNIRLSKICLQCEQEFVAKTTVTKTCSDTCAKRYYKARKREEVLTKQQSIPKQKIRSALNKVAQKEFLSINESCELIGVSRMTLYRQIKSGNISAGKIGSRTIVKKESILKLLAI